MKWRFYDFQRGSFCLYLTLILLALAVTDLRAQSFVPAGTMTRPRYANSATLLQDGRVLIAGGEYDAGLAPSAEIYDPVSGTFAEMGAPIQRRSGHAAVLLRDGRVLLVGGCQPCAAIAELYNPGTGTFTRTGDMSVAQRVYSAVLLKNGKVLVVGGITAELFDPATEIFVSVSSTGGWYGSPFHSITATLLAGGTVLLASDSLVLLYDPVNEVFRQLPTGRIPAGATATPLLDGSVLFAGGGDFYSGPDLAQSIIYDPGIQAFKPKGNLTWARTAHTATLLKDGRVLIAGGIDFNNDILFESAELYNPATGTFSQITDMLRPRTLHTATLLRDGRVLITGNWGIKDATAELFVPESTQGAVPRVTLDWSRYCVGDSWILRAEAAAPSTSVQISGTFDGSLWTIPEWTTTGQDGALLATGIYTAEAAGDYTLWLYVGGKVSNTVSVRIETCSVQLELNSTFHVGDSWTARVTGGMPGANVTLLGIRDTSPWIIESWGRTDSGGTFVTNGNFPAGTEDKHALRVVVGAAQSNVVRFSVMP